MMKWDEEGDTMVMQAMNVKNMTRTELISSQPNSSSVFGHFPFAFRRKNIKRWLDRDGDG